MKFDFVQFVSKDSVMTLTGKNKLEVMEQLISRATDLTKLDRDVIFRLVWKREQMMTTGVGGSSSFAARVVVVIRVVSSAYLRLLLFLPPVLIPTCNSSSPADRKSTV